MMAVSTSLTASGLAHAQTDPITPNLNNPSEPLTLNADGTGYDFTPEQLAWLDANRATIDQAGQALLGLTPEQAAAAATDPDSAVQIPTVVEISSEVGLESITTVTIDAGGLTHDVPGAAEQVAAAREAAAVETVELDPGTAAAAKKKCLPESLTLT